MNWIFAAAVIIASWAFWRKSNESSSVHSSRWPRLATILVLIVITWFTAGTDHWAAAYPMTGQKQDYYNLLVDGFLNGTTYMKMEPHPDLSSPDPTIRLRTPFLLDANLYQGRYYLYYGVVPAVLLFVPYAVLTGHDLATDTVLLICVTCGFLCAVRILLLARARFFPSASPAITAVCIFALGFGTGVPALLTRPDFYEVPIGAGYACVMAGVLCLFLAGIHRNRSVGFVALASLLFALAVGCRPNFILALPVVLATAILIGRRHWAQPLHRYPLRRVCGAAIVPAAVIGAALGAYNYARFGDPFQLGFDYGLNDFFSSGNPLMSPAFVGWNLKWYYLTPPSLSPFFPFVFPIDSSFRPPTYHGAEVVHGQFPLFVLGAFVLGSLMLGRSAFRDRGCVAAASVLGWIWLTSLAFMCLLGIRGNRYAVDFNGALVLLVVLGGAWLAGHDRRIGSRVIWRSAFGGLVALLIAFNLLVGVQQFEAFQTVRPRTFARLARVFDSPSHWLMKAGLFQYGPIKFEASFGPVEKITIEPLITTGAPYFSNTVYAVRYPGNQVEFFLDDATMPDDRRKRFAYEPGRWCSIEADLGSLYPPARTTFFRDYDPLSIRQVKTTARIVFDGEVALDARAKFHDAAPWSLTLGENRTTFTGYATQFSGEIRNFARQPIVHRRETATTIASIPLWRWDIDFPLRPPLLAYPIAEISQDEQRTLFFVEALSETRIRFGRDTMGLPGLYSPPISLEPGQRHTLEIYRGAAAARHPWPNDRSIDAIALNDHRHAFNVWLDGRLVWQIPEITDGTAIHFGQNRLGFSTATDVYPARLDPLPFSAPEEQAFIRQNLALRSMRHHLRMTVALSPFTEARREPLLSTISPGSDTRLYIARDAPEEFRIECYSQRSGVTGSAPISHAPGTPLDVEVYLPPELVDENAKVSTLPPLVRVNKQTVLGSFQPLQIADATIVALGFDHARQADVARFFTGRLDSIRDLATQPFLEAEENLRGPVRLVVRFPNAPGRSEPLLGTGQKGAGDLVYITYVDPSHVRIGYDHWGVGGPQSNPIPVDYLSCHEIEISAPALWNLIPEPAEENGPRDASRSARERVRVKLDGKLVLDFPTQPHPAQSRDIFVARNPIGASSCDPRFSGQLLVSESLWPERSILD